VEVSCVEGCCLEVSCVKRSRVSGRCVEGSGVEGSCMERRCVEGRGVKGSCVEVSSVAAEGQYRVKEKERAVNKGENFRNRVIWQLFFYQILS